MRKSKREITERNTETRKINVTKKRKQKQEGRVGSTKDKEEQEVDTTKEKTAKMPRKKSL